jgi:hypothetical protein
VTEFILTLSVDVDTFPRTVTITITITITIIITITVTVTVSWIPISLGTHLICCPILSSSGAPILDLRFLGVFILASIVQPNPIIVHRALFHDSGSTA